MAYKCSLEERGEEEGGVISWRKGVDAPPYLPPTLPFYLYLRQGQLVR